MVSFLVLNKVLVVLIDVIAVLIGFLVYKNNPKGKINRMLVLMTIFMLVWVNFAYIPRVIGITNSDLALLFLRIAWFITPLFFTALYFLVIYLIEEIEKKEKYKTLSKFVLFFGLLAAFLAGFTNLVVSSIRFVGPDLAINYGSAMLPFLGMISFLICATLYPLFKEYFKSPVFIKLKLQYFLIGIFIFYLANIIFNITFPLLFGIVRFYWIADYSTIFLLGFTAYAIVKRELFGIKVVLTTLLVALIAIVLLLDIFVLTEVLFYQLIKGFVLIVYLYFGYLLVKSVQKEVKLKEEAMFLAGKERVLRQDTEGLAKRETALRQRAERLLAAEEQFLLAIQHHLRTPLTGARNYIDELEKESYGKLPSLAKEKVKKANLALRILIHLVNDIIDISKMSLGQEVLGFQDNVQLEEVIGEVIQEQKLQAEIKELYLKFEKPKEPLPKMKLDPDRLKEAIYNLVDNGLKYTPQNKGGVTISLGRVKMKEQDYVQISISDTGIGLTPEEKETVLTFFFERGEMARKMWGIGKGVGLYISNQFIKAHSGEIKVESEGKDKGSTFYIYLPINPEKNEKNKKAKNSFH